MKIKQEKLFSNEEEVDKINYDEINNVKNSKEETSSKELEKSNEKDLDLLKAKYEIYKNYEKTSIVQKDEEFGDVIKYEDFIDKGLDKFDYRLTIYYDINKSLENDNSFKNLSKIVDEKSKLLSSNYKEEYKYNLVPYGERW